jgi:hypothetical protein
MFAHQSADLLVIDGHALLAKRRPDTAPPIVFELVADRGNGYDDRGVVGLATRLVIECRARDPHQPTSFGDGEVTGPVIADVSSLLCRGRACRAPFRNSSSRACFPTSRSSAAMRAS